MFIQLFPIPLFASGYVFNVRFFTGWVIVSLIWSFLSAFVTCLLPLWESKDALKVIASQVINDIFRRKKVETK